MYLLNAFSNRMLESLPATVVMTPVDNLPEGLESAIGHEQTAQDLGYPVNRITVSLKKGDVAYVASPSKDLGRLAEGATSIDGERKYDFVKVEIQ